MTQPQTVGVIGPAGFTGSYLCRELLSRGHKVVGISRHPENAGTHENYTKRPVDLEQLDVEQLADVFRDLDVLVSAYGPHTAGAGALQYMPFLEMVRKLILAVKQSKVKYFIFVGGAGSLHIPGAVAGLCAIDHPDWFIAYRRGIADSHAHVCYMEERLGHMGSSLREYRNARLAERNGQATAETSSTIEQYEEKVKTNDTATNFIKGARTSFMFFDGNTSFPWTYISPSALYRPGKRTGQYKAIEDDLPLKGDPKSDNILDGRLLGITAADLAIAITDEVETQRHQGHHWTAVGDLTNDEPAPSYVKIDDA